MSIESARGGPSPKILEGVALPHQPIQHQVHYGETHVLSYALRVNSRKPNGPMYVIYFVVSGNLKGDKGLNNTI